MANISSALVKEIKEAKDVFTKLLQEGIASGDKAAEDAARTELKSLQELERQYTKLPATTGKPGKGPEQLGGLPREKQSEFMSKQLEQSKSRAENLLSESRRKAKEAQQRGFAQGTGETIELGAGAQGVVPYKKPGVPTTTRRISEAGPVEGEVFERVKAAPSSGAQVIDVEAKDVPPLQLRAAEGDEGGTFIRQEPGLRGGGETRATPRFDERGFEIKPGAAESVELKAEPTELKSKIDRFKAPAGVAAGLGLAGSYTPLSEEPARFPGDKSQAEVMAERTAPAIEEKPTTLAGGLGLGGKQKEAARPKSAALQGRPGFVPVREAPPPAPPSLRERIEQSMTGLGKEREAAKAERDEAMRRADVGELASLVGRSLAQIGAAAQGMRTGVDMSGVAQKALVDWDRKREQVLNSYDSSIKDISRQQESLLRQAEREEDREDKKAYQKSVEMLEHSKMAQQERLKKMEIELENQRKIFDAAEKGDKKVLEFQKKAANANVRRIQKDLNSYDRAEGIYARWQTADRKDKDKLAQELRGLTARTLGPEAVAAQKEKLLGLIDTEKEPDPDKLVEVLRNNRSTLEEELLLQQEIADGIRKYQSPEAGQQQPPAQTTVAKPARALTKKEVEDYAALYKMTPDKAKAWLKSQNIAVEE